MFGNFIGKLGIDLELNSSKVVSGAQKAQSAMGGVTKATSQLNKVLGALAVTGGGAALSGVIKSSIDAANHLNDLSDRLGVTAEGLSRLQYAAELTGVSSNTLEMGLQRMTRRVAEAANGTGEAVNALKELGLSASKLSQLRPEQQFEVLADALEGVPNQADKVRLSMKLLDSEGVALLQTMKGGSAALRKYGEEADATGKTISTKFAQDATAANAALKRLGAVSTGLANQMGAQLAPTLEAVATFMADSMPDAANYTSRAFNGVRAVIAQSAAVIIESLRTVTYAFSGVSDTMASLDKVLFEAKTSLNNVAEDFANNVIEAANETDKLVVTTQKATTNFNDYVGATESAAEATKKLTDAQKQRDLALQAGSDITTKFDTIRESLMTEEQLEIESHGRRMQEIQNFAMQNSELAAYAHSIEEQERERHQDALTKIDQNATRQRIQQAQLEASAKFGAMSSIFGNLSTLMNSGSKKLFKIGKIAAIANAIVNTAQGVTLALAQGGAFAAPMAAAVAAAGAVQLATIRAQQFGGGGTVSTGGIGSSTPNVFRPAQPQIPIAQQSNERALTINFNGDVSGVTAEGIAESLKDYINDTDFVLIESTSRNGKALIA
jgi:hypothetical protein